MVRHGGPVQGRPVRADDRFGLGHGDDQRGLLAHLRDAMRVEQMSARLAGVGGVVGVVLGGSRARGTHRPDSDWDLGLYYRGALDLAALRELAAQTADEPVEVTAPGGWGPWVDGGGWLTVRGERVDWIYRDLDRVRRVWDDCRAGRYEVGVQAGHPLGFFSHAYAGELALGRILADPTGELAALRAEMRVYPPALAEAVVRDSLWDAGFTLAQARKGYDPTYAAGCLFRAVGAMCQAVHAREGRWLINEKGMVAAAGLPDLLSQVGSTREQIDRSVAAAERVLADLRELLSPGG